MILTKPFDGQSADRLLLASVLVLACHLNLEKTLCMSWHWNFLPNGLKIRTHMFLSMASIQPFMTKLNKMNNTIVDQQITQNTKYTDFRWQLKLRPLHILPSILRIWWQCGKYTYCAAFWSVKWNWNAFRTFRFLWFAWWHNLEGKLSYWVLGAIPSGDFC